MSWRDFELLVGDAFRRKRYAVEKRGGGAPAGGVDLVLCTNGKSTVVQRKPCRDMLVSGQPVLELFAVMHAVIQKWFHVIGVPKHTAPVAIGRSTRCTTTVLVRVSGYLRP